MADFPMAINSPAYTLLPYEVVAEVTAHLSNRDIKNLRLACRFFAASASLRLTRAFLSPNPLNIEVFLGIAAHEDFNKRITEIVVDDALLPVAGTIMDVNEVAFCLETGPNATGCENAYPPNWFHIVCHANIEQLLDVNGIDRGERWRVEQLPWREAWKVYVKLVEEQTEAIESGAFARAFDTGLASFPALKKVTISGATHGRTFNPLYNTPMIRAFPPHFNYPLPSGWIGDQIVRQTCPEWKEEGSSWIGFRTAMRALARNQFSLDRIVQLEIDGHDLNSGLNKNIFKHETSTAHNLEMVISGPQFTHLQLDFMLDGEEQGHECLTWMRSGPLPRALQNASSGLGLEHLVLRGNMPPRENYIWRPEQRRLPLEFLFTPKSLSRLQHFGLSGFWVRQDDVMQEVLQHLPPTIRTIELSCLEFMQGHYHGLLTSVYETSGWKERDIQPALKIHLRDPGGIAGRVLDIDREVEAFLYRDGENPFVMSTNGLNPVCSLKPGLGVIKDAFAKNVPMSSG
ncbi:hypothetical protein B0I35DRAFT_439538 [Stachybotrys elegans]|uniref:F-box domain-containing protein n=1 Tax=Stachybotrys elegans TaxID=80388 RepID=A0A8K0SK89_9HYPO|nr:hypothetical protein B0I35DRAFT_439538 [Stachybotrys elegans]